MNNSELKKYLEKRIERVEERIDHIRTKQGDNPSQTHNYHGGWSLGYWEGKCSTYKSVLDKVKELEGTE